MEFIKIENKNTWILNSIPQHFPGTKKYIDFWRTEKQKCIEGLWGPDFDGYRYMPPNIYFYCNFVIITDTDEDQNVMIEVKPELRDLEWELSYAWMEARGFSGFEFDEYYSCDLKLKKYLESDIKTGLNIHSSWLKGDGTLKTFKPAREVLRQLHSQPLGRPLYRNNAKNIMVLGSRGGGKSFFTAGAIILHELIFDGKKYYDTKNPEGGIKTKTSVFVGAAQSTYSSDILEKVSSAMNALAINPNLGIYGNPTNPIESNYTPNPFYKNMRGSLQPNNKKSPWVHKYEKKVRGKWIDGFGTNAKLFHGIYSAENPQAAAGTRPSVLVIEEVGLLENLITPHQSNEAAQTIGSKRIGSAIYIGTAGNMEKIRESREVFTDPDSYSMLEYNDDWEHSGKIGFFLPAYYTNKDFKDENGNTDVEKARQYYLDRREKARKASNPKVYEGELMNYPIVPSEMFIGRTGNILPVAELKEVEKKLIKNNIYQRIGTPIDIFYDSTQPHGVDYKVIPDKRPLFEYPIPKNADIEGCITMYEAPIYVNGIVPNDLYNLVGYDPYVSENLDEGESLGSVYVMKNPKYLSHGYGGNEIVAGYVGKHAYGTNAYNENVEKLLMLYGNPYRGLWFEADRGKHVKSFFENKYKLHLLCLRPQKEMNTSVVAKKVANYGWITGSKINKIQLIDMLADWLKEETEINGIKKRNLERIPDIGLIRELQAFQLEKGNYDRVMALVGCVLGLRETENLYKQSTIEKHNPLSILVANKYFKTHKDVKKYRTKV